MALSTQTRLEAKVRAARLKIWADKDRDDAVDAASITAALAYGASLIHAYCSRRFGGSIVFNWTSATCPPLLQALSEDISLYWLATGSNQISPPIQILYDNALDMLAKVRDSEIDVVGVDGAVLTESSTEYAPIKVSTEGINRAFTREQIGTPPAASRPDVFSPVDDDDDDVETTE